MEANKIKEVQFAGEIHLQLFRRVYLYLIVEDELVGERVSLLPREPDFKNNLTGLDALKMFDGGHS